MTDLSASQNSRIFTVSSLNAEVRLLLENEMGVVWLVGELSNFSMPVSGHWYFTLKDSRAQVKCAMFKGHNRRVLFKPTNGNQVLVKARLSLYEPRGDYQLIVESMQPEGDGRLQQQFDALKQKLVSEGLFDQALKRPLPVSPARVGIITSQSGAALQDILNILQRRDPGLPIVIYPTLVQGDGAAISIAQAIGRANARNECDVLIVGRGGGSLEDLWCFNEEIVARTIAASQIPIISAVGHEVDVTIADFVADMRAPTPSAAAELVSRDQSHRLQKLEQIERRLSQAAKQTLAHSEHQLTRRLQQLMSLHPRRQLQQQSQQLDEITLRLQHAMQAQINRDQNRMIRLDHRLSVASPQRKIAQDSQRVDQLTQRLHASLRHTMTQAQHRFALAVGQLESTSPLTILNRGYSMTTDENGKVVTKAEQVTSGDTLITQVAEGKIYSVVSEGSSK
uniref:exodeoxyribonuclease VII large subunit n=1 Tax=Thaumasiovibrio occultus TaxID=1891184 RepID=UPI000B35ACD2|nr:exodeoxyribonuclease VII large subunit [Thaumasiovibrio occultus]